MKLITANVKMADAVHGNYLLIPVINRFGIRLGFGDQTIGAVCANAGIDTDFFLAIINAFCNEDYFPAKKLRAVNVLTIVGYLKKTHEYYRRTQIPVIESYLKAFLAKSLKHNPGLRLVRKFFLEYKKELLAHLRHEETTTFPYVEMVYRLHETPGRPEARKTLRRYSMEVYEREHHEVDEKLTDLKNILIKYIGGEFDDATCSAIVFELFRLEKDIMDHTRIENNVLMPIVGEMEKALRLR